MALFNKEKVVGALGKAVDKVNETADKAGQYAKDKEWDKKAENIKNKTTGFIKEHDIDTAAHTVAGAVGTGLKKAGEGIEKAGASLEKTMNEKKSQREKEDWKAPAVKKVIVEEGTWRPVEEDKTVQPEPSADENNHDSVTGTENQ